MNLPADETIILPETGAKVAEHRRMMRRGETCPRCGLGILDYNGLIDLECPTCGYTESAGGGCT